MIFTISRFKTSFTAIILYISLNALNILTLISYTPNNYYEEIFTTSFNNFLMIQIHIISVIYIIIMLAIENHKNSIKLEKRYSLVFSSLASIIGTVLLIFSMIFVVSIFKLGTPDIIIIVFFALFFGIMIYAISKFKNSLSDVIIYIAINLINIFSTVLYKITLECFSPSCDWEICAIIGISLFVFIINISYIISTVLKYRKYRFQQMGLI